MKIEILNYLRNNYHLIYGESPDDWKPFIGIDQSVSELIDQGSVEEHFSYTAYVNEHLNINLTELLSGIEVLFIDLFALYLDKYSQFSIKADYACDRGVKHKCCFLIDMASLSGFQNKLLSKKDEIWSSVSHCYTKGCQSNRIIYGIHDLYNFKNYLTNLPENQGEPSAKNYAQANKMFGPLAENQNVPRLEE